MAGFLPKERWVGIDLSGDRSTTVLQTGEIIRSELGGHDTPNLVSFKRRERLIGEPAVSMVTSTPKATIGAVHTMAGTPYSSWVQRTQTAHLAYSHSEASCGHPEGGVAVTVDRQSGPQTFSGTELLTMYLCKLRACAAEKKAPGGSSNEAVAQLRGCFSSPESDTLAKRRALLDAARIAGFADPKVFPASDCLCTVYARKHPVPPGSSPERILVIDMGRLQTTVIIARFGEEGGQEEAKGEEVADASGGGGGPGESGKRASMGCPYSMLARQSDEDLGAFSFDLRMFDHFQGQVESKYGHKVLPGTKSGLRLLLACRRLRELLSTTPTAGTTVENLLDGVDVPLSMSRTELATLCEGELGRVRTMVRACLEEAGVEAGSLAGAQALGGGCRMPAVQDAVGVEVGLPLGSKLDSASLAYGAALLAETGQCLQATQEALAAEGMSEEERSKAAADEQERQKEDDQVRAIALERNELEALLFDMRSTPAKKHGELLDKAALEGMLDTLEEWLYSEEADDAGLDVLRAKRQQVDKELKEGVANVFFEAVEADKRKVEAEMEAEAKAFELERKNNPEENEDHDTRKLPKPERMRLVSKNKEAGDEVRAAITAYLPPDTYDVVPKPNRATSWVWTYGVKMVERSTKKVVFACFGSPGCRANSGKGVYVGITKSSASNAVEHIRAKHAAGTPKKTLAAKAKTDRLDLRVLKATSSAMYTEDHPRFLAMSWVKCHVIEGFCPLSHGEKEWVRACLRLTALNNFPVTAVNNRAVKHKIVEMYAATASRFKEEMAAEVGGVALLHLSLDLWVDKFSSLKYMGSRLFYVDKNWTLKSRLIAVRQFNPTKDTLEGNRLSGILLKYLESVLEEYGLDTSLLFSATSDAASDVKRLCKVLLPGLWEWCVCHMINCALVEAFGTHVDPAKSHNPKARKVIVVVKKVVEHIRKSPRASAIFKEEQVRQYEQCSHRKLVNAAPQRWSGMANVLEAVIVNRAAIDGVYAAENKDSPLTVVSEEIEELYSIIKPAAQVIVNCQQTHVPTGPAAMLATAALKLTTLNVDSPLDILTPARKLAQGGAAGVDGGERPASSAPRDHASLTAVARDTRQHLLDAVGWRWFDKRYKDTPSEDTDYLFDMQMALHPTTADLGYVEALAPTAERAAAVKETITDKVVALAVKLEEAAAAKGGGSDTTPDEPAAKRPRQADGPGSVHPLFRETGNGKDDANTKLYASLGLLKRGGDGAGGEPPSLEERARAEVSKLRTVVPGTLTDELSCEGVLKWWKRWAESYPLLARVARVVFGAPASAAVLERDFSDAGRMMTSSRSSMDSKYVEMILFLHGNLDLIPPDIPKLSADSVHTKIPGRLLNPVPELEELDGAFGPVDISDGE